MILSVAVVINVQQFNRQTNDFCRQHEICTKHFIFFRTVKFMYNIVKKQFPNDVVQIGISELLDFNDFND